MSFTTSVLSDSSVERLTPSPEFNGMLDVRQTEAAPTVDAASAIFQRLAIKTVHTEPLSANNHLQHAALLSFLPEDLRARLVQGLIKFGILHHRSRVLDHVLLYTADSQLAEICATFCKRGEAGLLVASRALVKRFNDCQRHEIFRSIRETVTQEPHFGVVLDLLSTLDLWPHDVKSWLLDGFQSQMQPSPPRRNSNCNLEQSFQQAIEYMSFEGFCKLREILPSDCSIEADCSENALQQLIEIYNMTDGSLVQHLKDAASLRGTKNASRKSRIIGAVLWRAPRLSLKTKTDICEFIAHNVELWTARGRVRMMKHGWISSYLLRDSFAAWYAYAGLSDILLDWQGRDDTRSLLSNLLTFGLRQNPLQTIDVLDVIMPHLSPGQLKDVHQTGDNRMGDCTLLYWDLTINKTLRQETLQRLQTQRGTRIKLNSHGLESPDFLFDPWSVVLERCGRCCSKMSVKEALPLLFKLWEILPKGGKFRIFSWTIA